MGSHTGPPQYDLRPPPAMVVSLSPQTPCGPYVRARRRHSRQFEWEPSAYTCLTTIMSTTTRGRDRLVPRAIVTSVVCVVITYSFRFVPIPWYGQSMLRSFVLRISQITIPSVSRIEREGVVDVACARPHYRAQHNHGVCACVVCAMCEQVVGVSAFEK